VRIYPSRAESAEDLYSDIVHEDTTKIRIIGISLNDFALAQEPKLGEAWEKIRLYVTEGKPSNPQKLDIKILLIDPNCHGATLRSFSQIRKKDPMPGHLKDDVDMISETILGLVRTSRERSAETGVTFECRLYRLPPILFLCLVDSVCYVQQYHFWSRRERCTPIPVLKYRKEIETGQLYQMHPEMEAHFDWIWQKASIDISDYSQQAAVGIETGMYQSSAVNVYTNPEDALKRMLFLLHHSQKQVDIQGVSLLSFCKTGDLFQALTGLIEKDQVKIRMLFIDPECEQAMLRSYREVRFSQQQESWEDYRDSKNLHRDSDLFRDTTRSIQKLTEMVQGVVRRSGQDWKLNIEVGVYNSAPHCFILRVDESVLVEQYHYGKIIPSQSLGGRAILGKDMPIIEYGNQPSDLYQEIPLRHPFSLLENHFEFAWELSRKINLSSSNSNIGIIFPVVGPSDSTGVKNE